MSNYSGQDVMERATAAAQDLPIRLAIADYDRTRPLANGQVKPVGITLDVTSHYNGDFCERPVYEQYDVAEMSFSWYVMARSRGEPVIALPIFPLRMPVLAYILVRKDSSAFEPKDLAGKRLCVASYRFTVNLWLRGLFRDHYGLSSQDVTWVTCGKEEGAGYVVPPGVNLIVNDGGAPAASFQQLLERPAWLLERDEVDAIIVPELPRAFVEGRSALRRLFRDAQAETQAFTRRVGFLPVTHVLVMHENLSAREPWICESLLRAFTDAQRTCDEFTLADPKNLSLPDSVFFLEQHRANYQTNIWAHGVAANRRVVETFLQYAYEQNYTERRLSLAEIFPRDMQST
jgi:4,5-dihydroxyphthalate decarboxylase